jgi:urease accessory protein UreE
MANNPKKSAPKKKTHTERVEGIHAIRVPLKRSRKTTRQEVELAIKKRLASEPTDVLQDDDTLVIVVERF